MFPDGSIPASFGTLSPRWSLWDHGHMIAGALVEHNPTIEAHILLDGRLLYRSRHTSRDAAEQELLALRGHWTREGWLDAG